ncbi:hypothetical protein M513_03909 [Trichuris suis]|uniref:Uncharacterized protein n=1 Tax=Trichuris suis TaxID=68888 RepID=A0A085MDH2_9BILA|nr:hypothetical protein M513_03909 [Trichuris suis]
MPGVPAGYGPRGIQGPSCFDQIKVGFVMGASVGATVGVIFGGFSALSSARKSYFPLLTRFGYCVLSVKRILLSRVRCAKGEVTNNVTSVELTRKAMVTGDEIFKYSQAQCESFPPLLTLRANREHGIQCREKFEAFAPTLRRDIVQFDQAHR